MYFKRFFQTGIGGSDPRNRTVAVYQCDACGHDEWYVIPNAETFTKDLRRCPKCQAMGAEDLRKNLEARRAELLAQEVKVRAEIEKVILEIERLEQQKEVKA